MENKAFNCPLNAFIKLVCALLLPEWRGVFVLEIATSLGPTFPGKPAHHHHDQMLKYDIRRRFICIYV
ncbi:hypothetical protein CRP01_06650 [Flavilitoribacter nigricans DSM 23189 = NBRC 102662]|uniref:Uncharacterized protein n=1 Tax=Flavilitoribacter nigricans (strain ATCC 23147 / DSM 23189 / NBRC 102662 / NCIMB 1420 / SS-2) TaxID=1122177 RepID=A0A2D0NFM8_FLAN2|nr:hypothetical protein CRP01_06650 [Flavilitoribacter nigricans DSM 23189 = NBRC 102662]